MYDHSLTYQAEASVRAVIMELLWKLGPDDRAIALSLDALGAVGHRQECRSCPIAIYLFAKLSEALAVTYVEVNPNRITIRFDGGIDALYVDADPPQAVADFIDLFDRCSYPYLDISLSHSNR